MKQSLVFLFLTGSSLVRNMFVKLFGGFCDLILQSDLGVLFLGTVLKCREIHYPRHEPRGLWPYNRLNEFFLNLIHSRWGITGIWWQKESTWNPPSLDSLWNCVNSAISFETFGWKARPFGERHRVVWQWIRIATMTSQDYQQHLTTERTLLQPENWLTKTRKCVKRSEEPLQKSGTILTT